MAITRTPKGYSPLISPSVNGAGYDSAAELDYLGSDGEPMAENQKQATTMWETTGRLVGWARDKPGVYVGMDMLVAPYEDNLESRRTPNIFVAMGVEDKPPRDSWPAWREGKMPDLIIEVAAPRTWEEDAGAKRRDYAEWGVSEYWRFNPMPFDKIPTDWRLIGERLVVDRLRGNRYEEIEVYKDEAGMLRGRSDVLGLDMCVSPDDAYGYRDLRIWDPARQEWLRIRDEG